MSEHAPKIAIARADPHLPELTAMIRELDQYMAALYPAASNHLVDVDTLAQPRVRFFGVSVNGVYCGCGAIMLHGQEYAEVKRIFVRPVQRGLGLARSLLQRLEEEARAEAISLLRLETGISQPEALALFEHSGYVRCRAFGDYPVDDPYSVFMEKRI